MAEQEQNGVTMPNTEAITFPAYLFLRDRIALVFSGGKYERMMETLKMITNSKMKILIVSNIKKLTALPSLEVFAMPKTIYVNQSANN